MPTTAKAHSDEDNGTRLVRSLALFVTMALNHLRQMDILDKGLLIDAAGQSLSINSIFG